YESDADAAVFLRQREGFAIAQEVQIEPARLLQVLYIDRHVCDAQDFRPRRLVRGGRRTRGRSYKKGCAKQDGGQLCGGIHRSNALPAPRRTPGLVSLYYGGIQLDLASSPLQQRRVHAGFRFNLRKRLERGRPPQERRQLFLGTVEIAVDKLL